MANPNSQSTQTLQQMYDKVVTLGDVKPVISDVAAYQLEPFVTICSDVYAGVVGVSFPHKLNEVKLQHFYTYIFQQDYALINSDDSSVYNVEWFEKGFVVEITGSVLPKTWG